jgi:hypothetical protein
LKRGCFSPVDADATANILVALINGVMRQKISSLDSFEGVAQSTIEFVRRGLVNTVSQKE